MEEARKQSCASEFRFTIFSSIFHYLSNFPLFIPLTKHVTQCELQCIFFGSTVFFQQSKHTCLPLLSIVQQYIFKIRYGCTSLLPGVGSCATAQGRYMLWIITVSRRVSTILRLCLVDTLFVSGAIKIYVGVSTLFILLLLGFLPFHDVRR